MRRKRFGSATVYEKYSESTRQRLIDVRTFRTRSSIFKISSSAPTIHIHTNAFKVNYRHPLNHRIIFTLTFICLFIVMQNKVIKYITRIGQKTGMLNTSKNVQIIPITVLFVVAYQNLNSGSRRMNGRNSSFDLVGNSGPWSSEKNVCVSFRLVVRTNESILLTVQI